MGYQFKNIENKWKQVWKDNKTYETQEDNTKPKYYVLDMFPYPSGSGLHVGHPLGYIASDIISRYKRLKGYSVLHPMGFDSFGLPAEQYAIQTGQHPKKTTEDNIANFKKQLSNIGFDYDWSRELQTSDPQFYKWTQWIFVQLYHSWFDRNDHKAKPIAELIDIFSKNGSLGYDWMLNENEVFDAPLWNAKTPKEQQEILMKYRLAFLSHTYVNWCEQLGTVLANDEVINGKSERGGYHVEKKKMKQWSLRITEYAERLLEGLNDVEFSESMKEMQRNWIGKSIGAEIDFSIKNSSEILKVFTTRPETIFGVDFMVLAPEHPLVTQLTTQEQAREVSNYIDQTKQKSEIERMAEVKNITGCFTGSYCIRPFDGKKIPIWISDYVLLGYGTGAIMAVPCGDQRDFDFANHFNIPITNICEQCYDGTKAYAGKESILKNSSFLDGLNYDKALQKIITELEKAEIGNKKINYKIRDSGFGRQRYWGEPIPILYNEDGTIETVSEDLLPVLLPDTKAFEPTGTGKGPLSKLSDWTQLENGQTRETDTMPGYAGSSWYFLRYMDPHNTKEFCSKNASKYWRQVDFYIGGTEHAVGHLLYSRFWNHFLYDLEYISHKEPYKKLVNQGMIVGSSKLAYHNPASKTFVSYGLKKDYPNLQPMYVNINYTKDGFLDVEQFKKYNPKYNDYNFVLENNQFKCESIAEKMSKRKLNTINPDDVIEKYGADCFRMYEMFLGPVEFSKPWDIKGIEGVSRFLNKFWNLFHKNASEELNIKEALPSKEEYKILHSTLKHVEQGMEKLSLNTIVSSMMIATNKLNDMKCNKKAILEPLLIALSPLAPFITEEIWQKMGNSNSIHKQNWVSYDDKYLKEDKINYPVSVNGKVRTQIELPNDIDPEGAEKEVLKLENLKKWIGNKPPKKCIFVKNRMINLVV